MSIKPALTRRQALMLSGSAAAGLVTAGLPLWAQGAPAAGQVLPITQLIEARDGEPVVLTLQKTHHRYGSRGPVVASRGISASYLGPVVRVHNGDTVPFRVENRLDEDTTLHWHGMLVSSRVDGGPHNTIRPGGGMVAGAHNQATRKHELVPSAPARQYGTASLFGPRRHDDRRRRRRPRSWPAHNLRRR